MTTHWGQTARGIVALDFWLIVSPGQPGRHPRRPSARAVARYPALGRDERAINLKINLPLALFEAPTISATISVEQPLQPVHIDTAAIADAVRSAIGMDIDIAVNAPEPQP